MQKLSADLQDLKLQEVGQMREAMNQWKSRSLELEGRCRQMELAGQEQISKSKAEYAKLEEHYRNLEAGYFALKEVNESVWVVIKKRLKKNPLVYGLFQKLNPRRLPS